MVSAIKKDKRMKPANLHLSFPLMDSPLVNSSGFPLDDGHRAKGVAQTQTSPFPLRLDSE
jgi:hypothetical protein